MPADLTAPSEFKVEIYADGETDMTDNAQDITIGYTDIAVEENGRFLERGNDYIALRVENRSKILAEKVRLRVLADSEAGIVIYDKYIDNLAGGEIKFYNVNINQLSNSSIAYAIISTESNDCYMYNNTELLSINPYLHRTIVPESHKIEKITLSIDKASLT